MATPTVSPIIPLNTEGQDLTLVDESSISSILIQNTFDVTKDFIQAYLYDLNGSIVTPLTTNYSVLSGNISGSAVTQLTLDPVSDLTKNNFTQGSYNVNYNFLSAFVEGNPLFKIQEISTSRTELRVNNSSFNAIQTQEVVNTINNYLNSGSAFQGYYLDFGLDTLLLGINIALSGDSILIKLYEPLPDTYTVNSSFNLIKKKSEPSAYSIVFPQEEIIVDNTVYLQGPNFNIKNTQQTNTSTDYQSYGSLFNGTTSLTNQLKSLLVERRAELNTDYTDFNNFVFFSSAEQRLINFYYKASLIESYTNQINTLSSLVLTTEVSASKAYYQQKIDELVVNFDGYDYFLYFDSGSKSWPKSNSTKPYTLYSTGSAQALTWYNEQLSSGSLYDQENQSYVYNIYPAYISEDSDNEQFQLFNEMVAQMFDQIWLYTKAIENRQDGDNRLSEGISIDLAADALRSYGISLYESSFANVDLYTTYLGITPEGSTLPPTGSELITSYVTASADTTPFNDAQKLIYKRLYHNLPYLLKKKGTVSGLRVLLNCFGIPDTILRINEFGGKDKDTNTWDNWQYQFNYAYNATGSNFVSSSFVLNSAWNAPNNRPSSVAFRFKPESNYPTVATQSLWTLNSGQVKITLEYTGSGLSSGSYSGSITNPYNNYGTLKFLVNSTDSASVYLPFFNGDWWSVLVTSGSSNGYTLYAKSNTLGNTVNNTLGFEASSSINIATHWSASTTSSFGNIFSGSFQEIRYYKTILSESVFDDFVMNPSSIEGNSTNSSPNELAFRASLGSELYTGSISIHPKNSGVWTTTASFANTSNYYFSTSPTFSANYEYVYFDQVPAGIQNAVSNKVKTSAVSLPPTTLTSYATDKVLSAHTSIQQTRDSNTKFTPDVNYVEIALSPATEINDDINSSIGYFNIGEYIGDPREISSSAYNYPALDSLSQNYFQKYSESYNWNDFLRLVKYFDNAVFKMLKDFIPARAGVSTGAVIKQHLLERNRQRPAQVDYSQPEYTGSITSLARDYKTGSIEVFTGGTGGSVPSIPVGGIQTLFYSGSLLFASGGPNTYFHNLLTNSTNQYYTYNISLTVPSGYTDGGLVIYDSNTIETDPAATNAIISKSMADISGTTQNYTVTVRDGVAISYYYVSINALTLSNVSVTHNLYDGVQGYPTQSLSTPAGVVNVPFSTTPYYSGDFAGSSIDVIQNKLQDNPLLGANYRVSVPDLQNINVQVSGTLRISSLLNTTSSVPFNTDSLRSPKYNTATYQYTPEFGNVVDFEVVLQGTYTASQAGTPGTSSLIADIAIGGVTGSNPTTLFTVVGGATSIFSGSINKSIVLPGDSYLYPNTYKVVLYESSSNGSATLVDVTASFNTNTRWTVNTQNLAAQSTYYLDPTVYTQQNFPGNINNFSDYNSLLNNVYSNRVSNLYYDVDYSTNALNPVNFQTILSQSALYAQIQDSNYVSGSAWATGRYNGTKLTSATYNDYTDGDISYGQTAVIDYYRDYFLYFKNIEAAGLFYGIPGGNVRGVSLIGIDGTVINLTPDNYNIGLVKQLFGTFDTVQIVTPTNYLGTDYSMQTLKVYIAGGYDDSITQPFVPFANIANETNILLINSLPTGSTQIYTDTPGYLIPTNFNKAYAAKVVELATQAGFPIN